MQEIFHCGHRPNWLDERGLQDEEWVHDRWD